MTSIAIGLRRAEVINIDDLQPPQYIKKTAIDGRKMQHVEYLLQEKRYADAILCSGLKPILARCLLSAKLPIRVKLLCNWMNNLERIWRKLLPKDSLLTFVDGEEEPDFWVVVNSTAEPHDEKRTVVLQMEPNMTAATWGRWANPGGGYLKVFRHAEHHNSVEWHISPSYDEILSMSPVKSDALSTTVSTVLSNKYHDPGHIRRIDFAKYLEETVELHVFGDNERRWRYFQKALPYHCKDDALFPYKYTFNAENNMIDNYFTEKLVDGILSECLVFYWGAPNVAEFIDEDAYIVLDEDFATARATIETAIRSGEWERRLPAIRRAKRRILKRLSIAARLEKTLLTTSLSLADSRRG